MHFITELRKEYVEVLLNLCLQITITTCNYFYSKIILFCEPLIIHFDIDMIHPFCDGRIRIL